MICDINKTLVVHNKITNGTKMKVKVRLKNITHHVNCFNQYVYVYVNVVILCVLIMSVRCSNMPPRFLIDGHTEIVLRLKEGPETPVGTLIYHLRGVDPDGDALTFGVRDQVGSEIINIENDGSTEANIYLAKELDRESKDEYALVLTVTDGRLGEGNFITQSLLILVEDVNDNEPIFKTYEAALSVREDATAGVLTTVEATDRDEGAYGQVLYYLQELDGDDEVFSISTTGGKGVIRLVGQLDYERKSLYQLRIIAVDRANYGRVNTGTASMIVKVQDVEDQPPEFVVASPVTRIAEDAPIGTSVLRVKAIDGDRGINNRISYQITKGGGSEFEVDRNTGVVYTSKQLDREDPSNSNGAYILEILATEESQIVPPPDVSTEVTIILIDVNDETPTFRSKFYNCEVFENAQANTPVTFLGKNTIPEVFDFDQGNNGTFKLLIDGDDGVFEVTPFSSINEANFLIRVRKPRMLDFEKNTVMNFTLIAKETVAINPKLSMVPVTVHIRDRNDNYPEFTEPIYEVSILENCDVGTTVAWVQALDEDSGNFGTRGVRYTNLSGSIAHLLLLNAVSGIITVRSIGGDSFDREVISRHYLTVEARDDLGQGNRNTVQLIVNLEDVNDNPPVFLQTKYEARIMENHMNFEMPLVVEANDLDLNGTKNSEVSYDIDDGEYKNNFTIDKKSGMIIPVSPLDFEQLPGSNGNFKPIYLTVHAKDYGSPTLATKVPVIIYIQDVNDHAPQFQQPVYKKSIPEDMASGSSILEIKAFDSDGSAPNNLVVYRIQHGAGDKFVIGPDSGIITVAHGASLDPDLTDPKSTKYSLTVIALDGGIGDQQLQSTALVNISIVDVNNKPPSFVDPGTVIIKENTQVGTYVYRVVANDPDDKPVLRYRIDPDTSEARSEEGTLIKPSEYDYIDAFSLNALDGLIRVVKLLDREKVEIIKLGILVEDIGAVQRKQTASAVLTVIIDDENDNNPRFRRPFYRKSITENSKNGVTITNIVADDADKNRTIVYSLEGPAEMIELVYLDSETGEIVVANKIDHESFSWLNLTVRATDSGMPPRSSLADVFIQVLDENDNNPYFISDMKNISISENTQVGTRIAVIQARDADSGDFGKITYLLDRMSSQGKFAIDPNSGILTIADNLDREVRSSYMLIIEAWDNYQFGYASGESRNAFKQILIHVLDENDEAPVLVMPEGCASIPEFHDEHEVISFIKATDDDDPNTPNGKVVFEIISGNDLGLFDLEQLDYWSARVVAARSLKGQYGNYSILIQARDMGQPPNAVDSSLDVCITDFNDHAPIFISPPQNVTIKIPENATVGSFVVQVQATDSDVGSNGAVRYRLKPDPAGSWHTFSIHPMTGAIELRQPLNRKKQKIYEIRVEAFDLGIPTPLSSDLDLTLYIRNVKGYEPQFSMDEFIANFTEHSQPGSEKQQLPGTIARDEVDDLDDPPATVCYFIVGGNKDEKFALDPVSHILTVLHELDREVTDVHLLLVKATEDCSTVPADESFFNSADDTLIKILVNVMDINDNPPKFISRIFTGGVTTAADFGAQFMHIKAIDADIGENGKIYYYQIGKIKMTLTEGLDNLQRPAFLVDRISGAVQLNFDPQTGMKGYFDFMVLANDTDGLQDVARVFIYLLREDQKVCFVLRQQPHEVRDKIYEFREVLGNVTGAIVNVDDYKIHVNRDGSVDKTRTDLYLHLVNRRDHSIMEVSDVLRLVDQNIEKLDSLFKEFNVLDTQPAEVQPFATDILVAGSAVAWLVASILFLGSLLVVVLILCLSQRTSYQRQLRAATATAFGSPCDSDMTGRGMTRRVPNTNKHSVEGSNPIWLQAYENEWYKQEDNYSQASERDSLDENAVVVEDYMAPKQHSKQDAGEYGRAYNVYHQIDKLTNAQMLTKKLETTEL